MEFKLLVNFTNLNVNNGINEIYLTELRVGDEDSLVECMKTDDISRYTLRIPFPYSKEDAIFWINYCQQQGIEKGCLWFFAIRINENGPVIGGISINDIIDGIAEIGYWLSPTYWGQGIIPAVIITFCNYIENNNHLYNIKRFEAHIFTENIQSQRAIIKCGFIYDGEMPNMFQKNGIYLDTKRFVRQVQS